MPFLILGIPLLFATGALAVNSVTKDVDQAVKVTGVNLVVLAAGALGLWAAFRVLQKAKF